MRHTTAANLGRLSNQRQSRLRVELQAVLNLCAPSGCTSLNVPGLDKAELCQPGIYDKPHQVARVARNLVEAILVPSCTNFSEGNLIMFPDRLRLGSILVIEDTVDPDLFIDRERLS